MGMRARGDQRDASCTFDEMREEGEIWEKREEEEEEDEMPVAEVVLSTLLV